MPRTALYGYWMRDFILLTHTDLDGTGCAVLARAVLGPAATIRRVENGAIDAELEACLSQRMSDPKQHQVVVTDHGLGEAATTAAAAFAAAGGEFRLLDHHLSSTPLAVHDWATIDSARSATGLFFEHLGRPPAWSEFSTLVEDHDLWRHQDARSARLAALLGLLGSERFMERFVARPEVVFSEAESLILERDAAWREEFLVKKVAQARVLEIGGERWALVYAEQHQSDLAERMMETLQVSATAIVNPAKRTVSLRGRGVDVSAIAERHGGGGHARAAAFSFRGTPLELDLERFEAALDSRLAAPEEGEE